MKQGQEQFQNQPMEAEGEQQEKKEAAEFLQHMIYWLSRVTEHKGSAYSPEELESGMLESLRAQTPDLLTVTTSRWCNIQCSHCIFGAEVSSRKVSSDVNLLGIVENMVRQMPGKNDPPHHTDPHVLFDGRTIGRRDIDTFQMIREVRPDARIGLIDNGTYTNLLDDFENRKVKLDWLDISIDGTEESHDLQRDPLQKRAYADAVHGLSHAREVVRPRSEGGRVTSLLTLTNINCADVEAVADFLFSENREPSARDNESGKQLPYADEFHITTMSPAREAIKELEISTEDMRVAFEGLKRVAAKYPDKTVRLRIYRHQDLEKLFEVIGAKRAAEIVTGDELDNRLKGGVSFTEGGVSVSYFPLSIWPQEGILVDADGASRTAYSQPYTLEEHRAGVSKDGKDITPYTVAQLDEHSNFVETYQKGVDNWWEHFGKEYLKEEIEMFQRVRKGV